jgi:hypothetical protein
VRGRGGLWIGELNLRFPVAPPIFQLCRHFFNFCFNFRHSQEYSEDSNSEPDVDLENQYYNSKALKEDSPKEALMSFQKVLDLETGNNEKGEWGFKALKQMIKINFKLVSCGRVEG